MNIDELIERLGRFISAMDAQKKKANRLKELAKMAREGKQEEAKKELRKIDKHPTVVDAGNYYEAVKDARTALREQQDQIKWHKEECASLDAALTDRDKRLAELEDELTVIDDLSQLAEKQEKRIAELERYTCGFTDCRYQKLGKKLERQRDAALEALEKLTDIDFIHNAPGDWQFHDLLQAEINAAEKFAADQLKRIREMK